MPGYVALLRAVNVGGSGKLPMATLRALCEAAGCRQVRTYIASGNAVFLHDGGPQEVRAAIETNLAEHAEKLVPVFLRDRGDMAAIVKSNPFPDAPPPKVAVTFLDCNPGPEALVGIRNLTDEVVRPMGREIFVFYPQGQGRSKLRVPAAETGTARNMNTVTKLAGMLADL